MKVQFLIPTVHGENRVGKVEAIPKLLRQFLEYAHPVVQGAPHAGGMRYSKHIGFRQETGRCRGFPSQPPRGVPSLPRGWLIAGDTPPGRGTLRLSCSHANSHTTGVCQRGNLITATHRDSLPEVAPPPTRLSPAALQGLPTFRGSYGTTPGIVETEILQDLRLTFQELDSASVVNRTVIAFHAL